MSNTSEFLALIRLRFNIENPSVEECYTHGYECGDANISSEENPFTPGSDNYEHWYEGWADGFYGAEPLFALASKHVEEDQPAANDHTYQDDFGKWILRAIEITGVIAASAVVSYQVMDMVA